MTALDWSPAGDTRVSLCRNVRLDRHLSAPLGDHSSRERWLFDRSSRIGSGQPSTACAGGAIIKVIAEFRRPFWGRTGTVPSFRAPDSPFFAFRVSFWDRPGPPTLWSRSSAPRRRSCHRLPGACRGGSCTKYSEMFPGPTSARNWCAHSRWPTWPADPWARGAVSVEPVGGAHLRAELALPTPPLFWAGEATATDGGAECVHGALTTGRRAVLEALHLLRPASVTDRRAGSGGPGIAIERPGR